MWFSAFLLCATVCALDNGSLEDLNHDGKPDRWQVDCPVARMVRGVKGQAVECELDRGPYWRVVVKSAPIPVKQGQRFAASIWLRGENVRSVHVKFHLFDKDGKRIYPYGLLSSPLRVDQWTRSVGWPEFQNALPREVKHGTWGWERWEGTFEVRDPKAKTARLEVWVARKGGKVWIDEAEVKEAAPGEKPPRVADVERRVCKIGPLSVEVLSSGREFLGLGAIRLQDVPLRSGALPWKIVLRRLDGKPHERCTLERIKTSADELLLDLGFHTGREVDKVRWRVSAIKMSLCGGGVVGSEIPIGSRRDGAGLKGSGSVLARTRRQCVGA